MIPNLSFRGKEVLAFENDPFGNAGFLKTIPLGKPFEGKKVWNKKPINLNYN
jgi:hypothetical protein